MNKACTQFFFRQGLLWLSYEQCGVSLSIFFNALSTFLWLHDASVFAGVRKVRALWTCPAGRSSSSCTLSRPSRNLSYRANQYTFAGQTFIGTRDFLHYICFSHFFTRFKTKFHVAQCMFSWRNEAKDALATTEHHLHWRDIYCNFSLRFTTLHALVYRIQIAPLTRLSTESVPKLFIRTACIFMYTLHTNRCDQRRTCCCMCVSKRTWSVSTFYTFPRRDHRRIREKLGAHVLWL